MVKFSIIIPVFNIESYLGVCVKSVLQQSYDNYEIILVEAQSGDNSAKICERFRKKHPDKISVIYQENKGLSFSRNEGAENAKGEYIIFVDGDDCLGDKDALKKLSEIADGCDIVSYTWRDMRDTDSKVSAAKGSLEKLQPHYLSGELYLRDALQNSHLYEWYAWRYVYRAEFWRKNEFQYRLQLAYEDIDLTYSVLLAAKDVKVLTGITVYLYRVGRQTSMSSIVSSGNYCDAIRIAAKNIRNVDEIPVSDDVKRMLNNSFSCHYYAILALASRITDPGEKRKMIKCLKDNLWVTEYTTEKKQKLVRTVINIVGLKHTMALLGIRMKIKKGRK